MRPDQRPVAAPATAAPSDQRADPEPAREFWRSEELLGSRREIVILHREEVYRLRLTRQGKLILYK
jgi:hemin uptake protein HemP